MKNVKSANFWMVLVGWALAAEWLKSGWDKWIKPDYMNGIGKTLSTFASKTHYSFYGEFLNRNAVPNAQLFGNIVRTSELLIAIGLVAGGIAVLRGGRLGRIATILLVLACYGAALLNLNFYLAAGWSGPSTEGVNLVMGLVEAVLGTYFLMNALSKGKTA